MFLSRNKDKKKGLCLLILLTTMCSLFGGCGGSDASGRSCDITGFYFDTVVEIRLFGVADENSAREKCLGWLADMERIFSPSEGSELYELNHTLPENGSAAPLSEDLRTVLSRALDFYELSGGAADPTIGSVTALWDFHTQDPLPPSLKELEKELSHVGAEKIALTDDGLIRTDEGTQLDLGYIAKGYIADALKEKIREELNVQSGIINLGGNVTLIGSKEDGSPWRVGIEKPFGNGEALLTIEAFDCSVVTSGVYERCFNSDGKFYHHILDPENGMPVENGLLSVTIVCADAAAADALSTACFVLGPDKGLKMIEGLDNAEALFIDDHMQIRTSSGFPSYGSGSVSSPEP